MNFYSAYRCHDYHFKVYGAMLAGQYTPALEAAEEMNRTLPEELLRTGSPPMADWLEGFVAIKQHVFVRFGKWHEILDQHLPFDQQFYCVTAAMMRYARTVAYASLSQVDDALAALLSEQGQYDEAEALYRADLGLDDQLRWPCQHPDNFWSLHGLHECLVRRGETVKEPLIRQRLDLAIARADVPITASCFCRLETIS